MGERMRRMEREGEREEERAKEREREGESLCLKMWADDSPKSI